MPVRLRMFDDPPKDQQQRADTLPDGQQRMPIIDGFLIYRRSPVELTKDDKPTGVGYILDPPAQPRVIGDPGVKPTHQIISGLGEDWHIYLSPPPLPPYYPPDLSDIPGDPNHTIWICKCQCHLGGIVTINSPETYEEFSQSFAELLSSGHGYG